MKECPRCNQPSKAKKGGFCAACQSWWYRIQLFSAREAAEYAMNFSLRLTRMEGRATDILGRRRRRRAA